MQVDFGKRFIKRRNTFPRWLQERLNERLQLFSENPHHVQLHNHTLTHPFEGCRSINITGDIRAIYELHGDVALFIRIGTHHELYGL